MKKSKQNNEEEQIQLLGNHLVSKSFFDIIFDMVGIGLGEDFWDALETKYNRWLAGRCLAFMAVNQQVPLKFVDKRSRTNKPSPTKWYALK